MSTVWAALGAVMGASLAYEVGGFIGAVAGMLVGISELANFGVIFALIGGRPQETISGAVGGLLGGLVVGIGGGQAPVILLANVGLAVGAVVGATLHAYIRVLSLPIILLERMLRRHQPPAVIALGRDGLIEHQRFLPATSLP
jgi:hypothetical protein